MSLYGFCRDATAYAAVSLAVIRAIVEEHHIFYVVDGKELRVVRVIHGRRDVETEVRR